MRYTDDIWGIKNKRYAVVSIAWTGTGGTKVLYEDNNLANVKKYAKYISKQKPRTIFYIVDKTIEGIESYISSYKNGVKRRKNFP